MMDFLSYTSSPAIRNDVARRFFVKWLLGKSLLLLECVFLISALALTACSHSRQAVLTSGAADYRHFPEGGGLFVSAAFGPDGRLWRIVPEKSMSMWIIQPISAKALAHPL